jgi:Ribbon-helix-helix protein, copG family
MSNLSAPIAIPIHRSYYFWMDNAPPRKQAKELVTIRVDADSKAKLHRLAEDQGRSVSALIDLAVSEFLDRRFGANAASLASLRVRHALLPDTSVLHAFQALAPDLYKSALEELSLPQLQFIEDRPEWRRLPADLFSGESDLVESVNLLPIFWHFKRGGSSLALKLHCVPPYLQLFVGHCVFVRSDHLKDYLSAQDIKDFLEFRNHGQSGKDLSLRSLVAWVKQSSEVNKLSRATALQEAWANVIAGCQRGTDYHIAILRVAPILAQLAPRPPVHSSSEPAIQGVEDLDRGFYEFRSGGSSAFIGSLLHSTRLLAATDPKALLLAGPADLRIPSLNTLAGRREIFDSEEVRRSILELWSRAVRWFREQIVMAKGDNLRAFVSLMLSLSTSDSPESSFELRELEILQSLMQTWVKWFTDPEEAHAFLGDASLGGVPGGNVSAEDMVKHYEELCELLNPAAQMTAPTYTAEREVALWKFPVLPESSGSARFASGSRGKVGENRSKVKSASRTPAGR